MCTNEFLQMHLEEAESLLSRGATFSGFVRLGEILRLVDSSERQEMDEWRQTVIGRAQAIDLDEVTSGAEEATVHLARILSTGGVYDTYELVLVLTRRIELESAEALLNALGRPVEFVGSELDDDVRALRTEPHNAKAFAAAQRMARKNWGFPIDSEWLA